MTPSFPQKEYMYEMNEWDFRPRLSRLNCIVLFVHCIPAGFLPVGRKQIADLLIDSLVV